MAIGIQFNIWITITLTRSSSVSGSISYPETSLTKEGKGKRTWLQTHEYLLGRSFKD